MRLGQGRENAERFLRENGDLADELEVKLRQALGLRPMVAAAKPEKAAKETAKGGE